MLKLCLFIRTILDEILNLFNLSSYLHHAEVTDLLRCLNGSPLQILSQMNNDRVEGQSKQ